MTLEPLSAEDARILALKSGTVRGHTCKVLVIGGEHEADEVREHVARRLDRVPRLTRRLAPGPGPPAWADDPAFSIADHVVGREAGGDADLLRLVGAAMATPLDRDRPLWAMDVVTGLDGGRTALVWRIHHAIADGVTAMRMARELLLSPPRRRRTGKGPGPPPRRRTAAPRGPPVARRRPGTRPRRRPGPWRACPPRCGASWATAARARRSTGPRGRTARWPSSAPRSTSCGGSRAQCARARHGQRRRARRGGGRPAVLAQGPGRRAGAAAGQGARVPAPQRRARRGEQRLVHGRRPAAGRARPAGAPGRRRARPRAPRSTTTRGPSTRSSATSRTCRARSSAAPRTGP